MRLGFIGLGKMGTRMVEKFLSGGHEVVVWNRTEEIAKEFYALMMEKHLENHLTIAETIPNITANLSTPRIIWLMLPAGDATQQALDSIASSLEKDDILIDGGNANWKDTQKRFDYFSAKGVRYLGIGVSGGILAPENGYPLMVGGDKNAYDQIVPLLDTLIHPNGGHHYFGTGGAGHFIKMVHNGIEYGFMQALGEGFGVLDKSPYDIDLLQTATLWQKGTIVQSFLLDRAKDALEKNGKLDDIEGIIAESGEARWTVEAAKDEHVPIDVIETSLEFRRKSQTDEGIQKSFAARMVAALRREFGGHEVAKK